MIDLRNKRILITGGGGFLGSHIVDRLREQDCTYLYAPRRAEYDLTKQSAVDRLFSSFEPEIVIHAAAVVGGIGANRAYPGRFFYENAIMGIQLIEAARHYRAEKLAVLGTICAYPKHTPVPFAESEIWNGYPEETNAPYGIAKKALLTQCQAYREQYGMNAIYLLPVNLYGPRDHFETEVSHVIPALIRKCVEARRSHAPSIVCWGDGTATREFLFVQDAARAIVDAVRFYDGGEPVNIGSGREISIRDLTSLIARITDYRGEILWDTSYPNGQPRRCLDTSRAEAAFQFRAGVQLEEGLRETVDWYCATLKHQEDANEGLVSQPVLLA
jgi:GDP-L-fucose synthase